MPAEPALVFPERKLLLDKLTLVVRLIADVVSNLVLIKTGGRDKVASCPECTEWKLLGLFLDPGRGLAFDKLKGVGNRVFRCNGEIEMNVLVSDVPGMDGKAFPPSDGLEYSLQFEFNESIRQHGTSILRGPNHVVITLPRAMVQLIQPSIGHGG